MIFVPLAVHARRAISAEKARNVVGARANGGKWFRDEKKPFSLVVACNLFVLVHSSSMSIRLLPSFITMANPTVFVVLSFHHFALLELSPPPVRVSVLLRPHLTGYLSHLSGAANDATSRDKSIYDTSVAATFSIG